MPFFEKELMKQQKGINSIRFVLSPRPGVSAVTICNRGRNPNQFGEITWNAFETTSTSKPA